MAVSEEENDEAVRPIWWETENPSPIGELKISLPIPKDGLFALNFDCSSSNILFTVVFCGSNLAKLYIEANKYFHFKLML